MYKLHNFKILLVSDQNQVISFKLRRKPSGRPNSVEMLQDSQ